MNRDVRIRDSGRKIPYKVGYTWNKGGRLKEIRIRHLARKFLWLWMQNTFGRLLPQQAKSHYNRQILRRAFEGWRDEWWSSMREWSLTTRAECHYKYHLCALTFQHWQLSVPFQNDKRTIVLSAQSEVDKHVMIQALGRWKVFTEMRRKKRRMLQTALELNKLEALHSAWRLWQMRLQQQLVVGPSAEKSCLKEKTLPLERRTWGSEHSAAASSYRENESEAAVHFDLKLKGKILDHWKSGAAHQEIRKKSHDLVQHFQHRQLLGLCWRKWNAALHLRQWEKMSTLQHGDTHENQPLMPQSEGTFRRNRIARQHYYQHLLRAGLEALSRNVKENKRHRLNSNIAVQHYCQTLTVMHWRVWKKHLEEAKDRKLHPLAEMVLKERRTSVLNYFFHCWRDKLAKVRHLSVLSQRADRWFADRTLTLCFKSWSHLTLQKRLHKRQRQEAEGYNRQRRFAWAFYTWWGLTEELQNQRLLEKIALQQHDRRKCQTAWTCWRRRLEQRREAQMALAHMWQPAQKEGNGVETKSRSDEGQLQQADIFGPIRRFGPSVEGEQRCLEAELDTWEERNVQEQQLHGDAEDIQLQQTSTCDAAQQTDDRFLEERAHHHSERLLQRRVLQAWRRATMCAVSQRRQQGGAAVDAPGSANQVGVRRRKEIKPEWISMERARQHHESRLLSKTMTAWRNHHQQCHKNKIRKRQGNFLLKLKMYQKYYELWKLKVQRRRRESEKTERALWHWSLTLQAKALHGWRRWLAERRGRKEQAAREAQVYRNQLLREGVSYILTYAAQMSDLTTTLTQYSEEQKRRRLHRLVKRCAMRWKQRALGEPRERRDGRQTQSKKTVTFCLSATEVRTLSPCYSDEDEAEECCNLRTISDHHDQTGGCEALPQSPLNIYQRQPDSTGEDPLLPPSAFMTNTSDIMLPSTCSSGFGDVFFQQPSTSTETSSESTEETNSALISELLSIQVDLESYQQDKQQLHDWRNLREVLTRWLQTSGKDERMENGAVSKDLQELEDRMARLEAELAERKPTVRLQVARVQRLHELVSQLGEAQK